MKLRPVLLLTGPVGPVPEVLVAYISSVRPTVLLDSDLLIDPDMGWGQAWEMVPLRCAAALDQR